MGNSEIIFSETILMKYFKLQTLSSYWEKFHLREQKVQRTFQNRLLTTTFYFWDSLKTSRQTLKQTSGKERCKQNSIYAIAKAKLSLKIRTICPIIPQQRQKMCNECNQSDANLSQFVLVLPQAMLFPSQTNVISCTCTCIVV